MDGKDPMKPPYSVLQAARNAKRLVRLADEAAGRERHIMPRGDRGLNLLAAEAARRVAVRRPRRIHVRDYMKQMYGSPPKVRKDQHLQKDNAVDVGVKTLFRLCYIN